MATAMRAVRTVTTTRRTGGLGAPPARGTAEQSARAKARARVHVIDVPFTMRGLAAASGARWDEDHHAFVWQGEALPPPLAPFGAASYSWERWVEEELNGAPTAPEPGPGPPQLTPRPHQQLASRAVLRARALGRSGFLLADDVGLGKTISAWDAVLGMAEAADVLIVCPLAVIAHWRRTIGSMGDAGKRVVVINYDRLGKLFEVTAADRKKIRSKKGLARRGEASAFDVVVWDESHRCKNPTAARSKLAAKLNQRAGFVLWLSATAGQNPLELSYLAPLFASATGAKSGELRDFEAWCQGEGLGVERGDFGRWQWRGDAADCEKIRALLFDGAPPIGLRRRPEDIAGWPEINRMLTPIRLEGEARALYDKAWTGFREEMALAPRGKNPQGALAAMLRLRQKSSLLRAPGTVELALELLENGQQVAISVAFLETLEAIRAALEGEGHGAAVIHGKSGAGEKERERLRFQRGEARVALFTVEEGISLHQGEHNEAPRAEVIHDLRWSAIQMAQIEGRCHRDGRFAQVYWTYADGTIEEQIAAIVCRRLRAMKTMSGDDLETVREIERLLAGEGA